MIITYRKAMKIRKYLSSKSSIIKYAYIREVKRGLKNFPQEDKMILYLMAKGFTCLEVAIKLNKEKYGKNYIRQKYDFTVTASDICIKENVIVKRLEDAIIKFRNN